MSHKTMSRQTSGVFPAASQREGGSLISCLREFSPGPEQGWWGMSTCGMSPGPEDASEAQFPQSA